jgi:hypothetical protein
MQHNCIKKQMGKMSNPDKLLSISSGPLLPHLCIINSQQH